MVETFHGLNSFQRCCFRIGEVVRHIHYVDGKAYKATQVLMHHVASPAGPDGSQPGAMRHVKHATQLMFQLVGSPVVADATACQSVVHQTATPHNLGAVAVVLGIL